MGLAIVEQTTSSPVRTSALNRLSSVAHERRALVFGQFVRPSADARAVMVRACLPLKGQACDRCRDPIGSGRARHLRPGGITVKWKSGSPGFSRLHLERLSARLIDRGGRDARRIDVDNGLVQPVEGIAERLEHGAGKIALRIVWATHEQAGGAV